MTQSTIYQRKRALIIGINKYRTNPLKYCINDAEDLAKTLKNIGFEVSVGTDCNQIQFHQILDAFATDILPTDLTLFYFSGHVKQYLNENYLLPSDYDDDYSMDETTCLTEKAIHALDVLKKIHDKECRASIFIFDCCRRNVQTKSDDTQQTLPLMPALSESLIVYTFLPGAVALDETNNSRNGWFAEHLLKHIATPDNDIDDVLKTVARDVKSYTCGHQVLFRTSSLTEKVYFATRNTPVPFMNAITTDDMSPEIFGLIWLDDTDEIAAKSNRHTDQALRSIINDLKKFQDIDECQKYIQQKSTNDRLVLIVRGQLGRKIIPSIHALQQVMSIYVYCLDKKSNEQWTKEYGKVKGIVITSEELVSRIKYDYKIQDMVEQPLAINTCNAADKSTAGINGQFVFSQVLIDCLQRLKTTQVDKDEFIKVCQDIYKGNSDEMDNIRKFQNEYSSDKALYWYTLDSFFYKSLNAALRKQDIHTMFLFRKYISDIYNQLKDKQAQCPLKLYRGQKISRAELDTLKQRVGQFISMNSFLSTSINDRLARKFLKDPHPAPGIEKVLFEIDADPKMATTKPFADISKYSYYPKEAEILFMLGSIFRLNSIDPSSEGDIWIIRMSLCSDDEHDLKEVLMNMKQRFVNEEMNLLILGRLLMEMSKFDLAERYLICVLDHLVPEDSFRLDLYQDLAKGASQADKMDKSVEWHRKAIALKKQLDQYRERDGVTVAGGNGHGDDTNQLWSPRGLFVDDDQTIVIVDRYNHRIIQWKKDATNGQIVAGGNGCGSRLDQLNDPTDVLIDKETHSLIICDHGNRRVVRWFRRSGTKQRRILRWSLFNRTTQGEIFIDKIHGWGLAMDDQRNLYISDIENDEVRRYKIGDKYGTLVAGGNGRGAGLNQLNNPTNIFVDRQQTVYVSDHYNHRVMKWHKGATEGIVIAGGQGEGNALTQLSHPHKLVVDASGTLYVADWGNHRVLRWSQGTKQGTVTVGGNGKGSAANQVSNPSGLSFDLQGNLYVADQWNHRVQRFSIE